jgi:hypothetical protein
MAVDEEDASRPPRAYVLRHVDVDDGTRRDPPEADFDPVPSSSPSVWCSAARWIVAALTGWAIICVGMYLAYLAVGRAY